MHNHGYEPQSKLWKRFATSCGVLYPAMRDNSANNLQFASLLKIKSHYPPLRGIVQLSNSAVLRFRNWSFTNKVFPFFPCRIFLLLLAVLASGCLQQIVIYPDYPPEKILASISSTVAEDDILSAIAQIDLVTIHGYQPVRAALIIKKPSYLRLELLPVIGTPDFFLAASPEKMSIFIPSRGEFYRGLPTVANLERFLPWQFNIEDIVMIFSGTYPSLKEKVIAYQSYREKNFLRIEMKAQSGCSQIIWVGENNRLLKLVRNDEHGKEIYNVKYDHYDTQSSIAEEITISMADGITSISIKYSDLKIEKATDLSIFDLPIPANVKTITMD